METLTHVKKLANPNFLGSYELQLDDDKFTEIIVEIERVSKDMVQNGDKKEEAVVVYIKGHKPFIANSTNRKNIIAALGTPFIEKWIGRKITLYVAKIKAFGETVDALRVRKEAPVVETKLPEFLPTNKNWQKAIDAVKSGKNTLENSLDVIRKSYSISEETLNLFTDETK